MTTPSLPPICVNRGRSAARIKVGEAAELCSVCLEPGEHRPMLALDGWDTNSELPDFRDLHTIRDLTFLQASYNYVDTHRDICGQPSPAPRAQPGAPCRLWCHSTASGSSMYVSKSPRSFFRTSLTSAGVT